MDDLNLQVKDIVEFARINSQDYPSYPQLYPIFIGFCESLHNTIDKGTLLY